MTVEVLDRPDLDLPPLDTEPPLIVRFYHDKAILGQEPLVIIRRRGLWVEGTVTFRPGRPCLITRATILTPRREVPIPISAYDLKHADDSLTLTLLNVYLG
jgi:hypothetical protein